MLDMRFEGLPRFVTGFRPHSGVAENDDPAPIGPLAMASGLRSGLGRTAIRIRPQSPTNTRGRSSMHLVVVK